MFSASGLLAQSPTPAQGRDYTGAIYRVVAVDSAGRIIISPVGGATCPGTAATPCIVAGPDTPGAAPTQNPVQFSLYDGANVRRVLGDSAGRLIVNQGVAAASTAGWPITSGQTANSTANWTDATPQDTALTISTVGYGNVTFGFVKTGVITGGVVTIEGSTDGVNYVAVSVVSIGASNNGTTTITLATQSNNIWQMFVGGLTNFRLRLSTAITGGGSAAAFTLAASTIATEFQQVVTQANGLNLHTNVDTLPGATTAQADAATNSPVQPTATPSFTATKQPVYPYKFNGATWDRDFNCPNSAPITFSAASGTLEIVALTSLQTIRICHISLSSTVATNITLVYGTGTNCGTGTTSLSGAYQQVTSMALDFGATGALRPAVSNAFCVTSSVSATVGGLVTYAKF